MILNFLPALTLLVASVAAHTPNQQHAKRHSELAELAERSGNDTLAERGGTYSGHATYFYVGLGACGQWSKSSDFIVALDTPQYGGGYPGPHCFKEITIWGPNGKSAQATIMDECPSCPYGSLDMSEGLFEHFESLNVGEFPITWSYNDGSGSPPPPPPPPPPPKKTTTHTTSTKHTTSAHHTTSTKHTTSTHETTSKTTTSDTPTTVPPPPANNLATLNAAFLAVVQIIEVGGSQ